MINLILKDIYFNTQQVCFGFLTALIFSSIILDSAGLGMLSILMVPSLLFSFIVGKMCHMEDKTSVYNYLKSLPIKKSYIVISKFIESYLILIIAYLMLIAVNFGISFFVRARYDLTSSITLIVFSIVIIYNSMYLFLNFKYSYAQAQQTVYVLMIIYFAAVSGYKYIQKNPQSNVILSNMALGFVFLGVAISISCGLCVLSIKAFHNKE